MNVCKLASYITLKGHSDWKHDSFFHERLVAPPNYSTFLFYEPCFIFYFFGFIAATHSEILSSSLKKKVGVLDSE